MNHDSLSVLLLPILLHILHTVVGLPTIPTTITVIAGHTTTILCNGGSRNSRTGGQGCQWTKDGVTLGTNSRYQVVQAAGGQCHLVVGPVQLQDEGKYQCQDREGVEMHVPVRLRVQSEPGQPYIVQAMEEDRLDVEQGEQVELVCESQGGRPAAEIQWVDGDGRVIVSDVIERVTKVKHSDTFKTVSTLKFKPSEEQQVKCVAHNEVFPAGLATDTLYIGIKGKPREEVRIVEEGEEVKIFCTDENIASGNKIKWFVNDVEIFDETNNFLEIKSFSKSYDKSQVKCSLKDENGKPVINKVVKLVYQTKIFVDPNSMPRTFDEILNSAQYKKIRNQKSTEIVKHPKKGMFVCLVEDNLVDEPKYVWINGKLNKSKADETVIASDEHHKYKCKAINKGMKTLNKMANDVKIITKTLKKFSETLAEILSPQ